MKIVIYNKRRGKRKILLLIATVILAAILVFILRNCVFTRKQTDIFAREILGTPVYTELIEEGNQARPGIERRIKYVVIHETGNPAYGADAKAHSTYLTDNNSTTTSWHYTVDDNSIYHHIPDTEVAWHAGDSLKKNGGNMCGIGVEICVNEDGSFENAFDNAAKLTAYLVDTYYLSVTDIRQHADFISKNCPETIRDEGRMDDFVHRVEKYLKELKT